MRELLLERIGAVGREGFLDIGNERGGRGVGFLIMGGGRSGEEVGIGAAVAKARMEKSIEDRMIKGVLFGLR